MKMKSRKSGISLISLIITIIVIIILAAVVIFSGMDTPEKAQLSKVISDIDNVQTAVDQAYYGLYTEKAVAGEVWTKSQFYEAVAKGITNRDELSGDTGIIEIQERSLLAINLPEYEGRKWGLALEDLGENVKTGSVLLIPGFVSNGKTYSTLLDVQNGGSDGIGSNGGQESLTEEDKVLLASIKIGDCVENYMEVGTGISWRVIDKNDETGEVLITTSDAVGGRMLSGVSGYIDIATKGENSKLNQYCKNNYTANKGETNVRSMTVEDINKLCRKYPITGENEEYSIGNLPLDDLDALTRLYYGEGSYGRYAYYSYDTPDSEVKDVKITKDGQEVTYHGVKLNYGNPKFYTYDDENGSTYTVEDINEYKTPIYQEGTDEYKCEPVLVSLDFYGYYIPEEVKAIIGSSNSWLASVCVDADSEYAYFCVRTVYDVRVGASDLYNSRCVTNGKDISLRPVVSLNAKLLEKGSEDGEYNSWKLK